MTHIRSMTTTTTMLLAEDWELLATEPGSYQNPQQLSAQAELEWLSTSVPGTALQTLQQHKRWDIERPLNADTLDWWYRCSFTAPEQAEQSVLVFAGLASLATVWLNGQQILISENMFRRYEVEISALLQPENTLYLHFQALQPHLTSRRPRPHWHTQLVEQQQLRWWRTTFLGRMPGWSPPIQAVGPWRPITVESRHALSIERFDIQPWLDITNTQGQIVLHVEAHSLTQELPANASLEIDGQSLPINVQALEDGRFSLSATLCLESIQPWWPHTHGEQPLYPTSLCLHYATTTIVIDCGHLAFRRVELLSEEEGGFGVRFNGEKIFCRGACWTPLHMLTLTGTEAEYREALLLAQQAGMNMLRVGGTMVYEADIFYDLCDELGILIWQDFLFANLDYPTTQEAFLENCLLECSQQLQRIQNHPCLTVLCGNSEIEQQVAMLGLDTALAQSAFFYQHLPTLCQQLTKVPYWPSSPSGGALPFLSNRGNSHYQGVGAYLRPLEDARRSEVRFASECLAFANVPEEETIERFLRAHEQPVHYPHWKARVPRDNGATWDFEDIRDYYLEQFYGLQPLQLRYGQRERYLAFSRVVTGEIMAAVFAEWRRQGSTCNGGLIWFYRDLWPGAGWGVIDAHGTPKAAYYYLKRILQPQTCFFADEGLNGLWLHIINETAQETQATLQVELYRTPGTLLARESRDLALASHQQTELHVDALFKHFRDLTYAYRFGPPDHTLVTATLTHKDSGKLIGEAFYFPHGQPVTQETETGLQVQVQQYPGRYELTIQTKNFAQSIAINAGPLHPSDNYFHMRPDSQKTISLAGTKSTHQFVSLKALNSFTDIHVSL
ncbi:glycoside hydrolase family 2 protein [Tengunoibacter tsumagoiensis]|uniref:beta-mannosidase n=1 Tax=Tengunoibacter tsumagoiensis TaxID=2014871 RepID=A0A402A1A8_9CHLR|nr:glycoside hydrolase family 2 protein [Tengunoibacter tsumagoiensis]GCE12855.1 beta-mannosidase [Tengunoibacter tsumagoiensis]